MPGHHVVVFVRIELFPSDTPFKPERNPGELGKRIRIVRTERVAFEQVKGAQNVRTVVMRKMGDLDGQMGDEYGLEEDESRDQEPKGSAGQALLTCICTHSRCSTVIRLSAALNVSATRC